MFQVAIFIALQPLSIFEAVFTGLPYAAAMPTATQSEEWKSALVVFASSKDWDDVITVLGPPHGGHSSPFQRQCSQAISRELGEHGQITFLLVKSGSSPAASQVPTQDYRN